MAHSALVSKSIFLAILGNLSGVIRFFLISGVDFSDECDDEDFDADDDLKICLKDGPIIAIAAASITLITGIIAVIFL
jgi:hypothetical protein